MLPTRLVAALWRIHSGSCGNKLAAAVPCRGMRGNRRGPSDPDDDFEKMLSPGDPLGFQLEETAEEQKEMADLDDHTPLERYQNKQFKDHRRIVAKIIERKYYKMPQEVNLLTWDAKEQIRFLNREYPEEWTVDRLAESFPASREGIVKVLKSSYYPKTEKEIAKHDSRVQKKWKSLKSGPDGGGPIAIKYEQLLKEGKMKTLLHASGLPSLPSPAPRFLPKQEAQQLLPKKGSFSSIVQNYENHKAKQKERLQIAEGTDQSQVRLLEGTENQRKINTRSRLSQSLQEQDLTIEEEFAHSWHSKTDKSIIRSYRPGFEDDVNDSMGNNASSLNKDKDMLSSRQIQSCMSDIWVSHNGKKKYKEPNGQVRPLSSDDKEDVWERTMFDVFSKPDEPIEDAQKWYKEKVPDRYARKKTFSNLTSNREANVSHHVEETETQTSISSKDLQYKISGHEHPIEMSGDSSNGERNRRGRSTRRGLGPRRHRNTIPEQPDISDYGKYSTPSTKVDKTLDQPTAEELQMQGTGKIKEGRPSTLDQTDEVLHEGNVYVTEDYSSDDSDSVWPPSFHHQRSDRHPPELSYHEEQIMRRQASIPEKIKIPRNNTREGAVIYQDGDAYYDEDGELLYKVP